MVFVILVVGLALRIGIQFAALAVSPNARAELQNSRSMEMWCRGTDVWLMGYAGLMALDVEIDAGVTSIVGAIAIALLFLCLYTRRQRAIIYDDCPLRSDIQPLKNGKWIALVATEYVAGMSVYFSRDALLSLA